MSPSFRLTPLCGCGGGLSEHLFHFPQPQHLSPGGGPKLIRSGILVSLGVYLVSMPPRQSNAHQRVSVSPNPAAI